jgi:hypothetical protein
MPPYKKPVSQAQAGMFWQLEKEGKMSLADAKGKTRGVKISKLPKHVKKGKGK